jgi:tetratricopeptide (TPR) repeat protein
MALPPPLSAFYPYPQGTGGNLPLIYYVSPVLLILAGIVVVRSIRRTRDVVFGASFYLVTMMLVLQLLPVGSAIIADRYTYLPYIGLFFLIGQGYYRVAHGDGQGFRRMKPVVTMVLIGYCAWLIVLTRNRCEVWKDNLTLWTDVLRNYPMVPVAYNNRALTYKSAGSFELALADYNKALEIKPDDTEAFSNRGNIYLTTGRYDLALADLNRALAVKPDLPVTLNSRGAVYFNQGRYDEALADFNRALELKPDYVEAYLNRGNALSVKKDFASAIRDYDAYLRFEQQNPNAFYWRGLAEANTGKTEEALRDFDASLALNPRFAAGYYQRSRAYYARREFEKAVGDAVMAKSLGYQVDDGYLRDLRSGQVHQ